MTSVASGMMAARLSSLFGSGRWWRATERWANRWSIDVSRSDGWVVCVGSAVAGLLVEEAGVHGGPGD